MSIVVPVCGGVVCDPCVGVGGGVEVGKIVDVELPSGKPAGEQYNSEDLCLSDVNMKFMILTNHCSYQRHILLVPRYPKWLVSCCQ